MNRHPGRWEAGDEVWFDADGERVYRQPDDAPVTQWVHIVGGVAPERPQDAPGRIDAAPVAQTPTPDPTPIPLTRAGRIRGLVAAVRKGDRSAVDALREALLGHD